MKLLEEFTCESLAELCRREGGWVRQHGTLNRLVAGQTGREFYEDNKERLLQVSKQYKESRGRESILEYERNLRASKPERYASVPCPCGGTYTGKTKATHEQTPKHQAYQRSLTEGPDELTKLAALLDEHRKCPCGGTANSHHMREHLQSDKHQRYLTG